MGKWLQKICALICLTLVAVGACSVSVAAEEPAWFTLRSEHFKVHFIEPLHDQAVRVLNIAEQVHTQLSAHWQWTPKEPTHIVLLDSSDVPNGFTTPLPFNRMVLYVTPPDRLNELENHQGWLEDLIAHEYTHVLQIDMARGAPLVARSLFGRFSLLFPNAFQPSWALEGFAVIAESNPRVGSGRQYSSLFEMLMREEVLYGFKPVTQVNLPIRSWPAGSTRYVYGIYFVEYLRQRFGEQALRAWVANYSDNLWPFRVNSSIKQAFGFDLETLWEDFKQHLQQRFKTQLEEVRTQGLVQGQAITDSGLSTREVQALSDGGSVYIADSGYSASQLILQTPHGERRELGQVRAGASLAVHEIAGVLVSQPEICEQHEPLALYFDLYWQPLQQAELKRLTTCGRYRFAAWHPKGTQLVAVHSELGKSALHLLTLSGGPTEVLWQGHDDTVISKPNWSPDGESLVAAVWRTGLGWNLEQFDLSTRRWQALTKDADIQAFPEYSADGRSITFTSDRSGIYNIYRLQLDRNIVQQLSNVESGAVQASMGGGELFYIGYRSTGYDVFKMPTVKVVDSFPLTHEVVPAPRPLADATVEAALEEYTAWDSLAPKYWFPYAFIGDDETLLGLATSGQDALADHRYQASLNYDLDNEVFAGLLNYGFADDFSIGFLRSHDAVALASGTVAKMRREDLWSATWQWYKHESLAQTWSLLANISSQRETDVKRVSETVAEEDTEDNTFGLGAIYDSRATPRMLRWPRDGFYGSLILESSDVFSSDYTGQVLTIDGRWLWPVAETQNLALRLVYGWGIDAPEPFELGGEESESLSIFSQRDYALRGYPKGLAQLTGRRMFLLSTEWRFPIARIERGWMSPPLGLHDMRGNLFVDTGAAFNGSSADDYLTGVGAELIFGANAGFVFDFDLRLGVAEGLDEGGESRGYLELGVSF